MKVFRSVKFRLTISFALILTFFLSLFAFFMYSELKRVLYKDMDAKLSNEARRIAQSLLPYLDDVALPPAGAAGDPDVSGQGEELPFQIRQELYDRVEVWERDNKLLSRSTLMVRFLYVNHSLFVSNLKGWEKEIIFPNYERDSVFMETGESYQTIHFQHKPVRLYYRLFAQSNTPLFVIQTGASIAEIITTLQRLIFIIWIFIPGLTAAAGVAGYFMAKRAFRPIDRMITKANQITSADLKNRLPRTHTGDEVDRLAHTLNEMMERIENSTRSIQEFSSNISHELKTPLAIIRGEIDLALRRSRSPDDLLQTLRVIEEETNELIRLVDDLMLLLRSDSRQLIYQKKAVLLDDLLRQVIERFQDRAHQKNIEVAYDNDFPCRIHADAVYFKRVISNLLDNAIKFTQQGGKISIVVRKSERNKVSIQVEDNGIGIDKDVLKKVFHRFYRADQARSHEGYGLGLNIARAITHAHDGEIFLDSRIGKGTRVFVTISAV